MSGCLLSCGLDGAEDQLASWIDYWEDGNTEYCEAGCELYLMDSHADGCLCASTAGSGDVCFRVWLVGRG